MDDRLRREQLKTVAKGYFKIGYSTALMRVYEILGKYDLPSECVNHLKKLGHGDRNDSSHTDNMRDHIGMENA